MRSSLLPGNRYAELLKKFSKYGGVAAGSAATDWIVFVALHSLGLNYLIVQLISRVAGGVFSFTMNRFWSFDAGSAGKVTVQGRRFLLLYGFSYVLSITWLYVLVEQFGGNAYLSKLFADGAVFVVNFVVMQGYVFRDIDGFSARIRRVIRSLRRMA